MTIDSTQPPGPRVAITGVGAWTRFGPGFKRLWAEALTGTSCLEADGNASASDAASRVDGDAADVFALAMGAAREAMREAGLDALPLGAWLVLGTNVGRANAIVKHLGKSAQGALRPDALASWADHSTLAHALALKLGGDVDRSLAVTGACASGALALGYGRDLITSGRADVVLAGGADARSAFKTAGHRLLRSASPTGRARPFDLRRDGTVFREGAAFLLLESEAHCLSRGAMPLALLPGVGVGTDLGSLTAPDSSGRGAMTAMRAALADADASPQKIDLVQAHATGTRLNDAMEARVIREVFGEHVEGMAVTADKGAIGHTLGACGPLSAALAVRAIREGCVPPIAACEEADPECELPLVLKEARTRPIAAALVNSFGFGGGNASIVLRRWEA